jgi:glucosamine--fructose-6-phosphate aminotransferase (isomerizing)
LGIGKNEHFLASDVSAIVAYTRDVVYLNDYEIIALQAEGFEITTVSGNGADYQVSKVEYSADSVDKGHYPHYMLKEIHEQPNSVRDALRGRLCLEEATAKLGGLNMSNADLRSVDRIVLVGCGTAFHAALAGEYLIESLAHIPVECEFASEFRYRNIPLDRDTLVFVVSQSGETADTLAALRESQRKGHRTLGICNNVASTIARESDGGVYMHAGPEIGVAATKSFTSQLTIFALLGLLLGRIRHLSHSEGLEIIAAMEKLPDLVARTLQLDAQIAANKRDFDARYARARLLAAHLQWTEAMDELLEILMRDKAWSEDAARKTYIAILDIMEPPKPKVADGQIPPDDPVVATYRRRLSSVVLS